MNFVQHVWFKSSKEAEVLELFAEWERVESIGNPSVWLLKDRDNPGTYLASVVFDSYEEAMKNNDLPATQEMAARLAALCDDPPRFANYDLLSGEH